MTTPFVVLVTGHPAAGKSTLPPRLARSLGVVCLSKDEVRYRVFDGWKPDHPVFSGADLAVGEAWFDEDQVVWSTYFWAVEQAVAIVPVVAETAMTRPENRDEVAGFLDRLGTPAVEVVLQVPLSNLLERYAARQASPASHRIYRTFPPGTESRFLARPYEPLLPARQVLEVDATDPAAIDVPALADRVLAAVARP